MLHPQAEELNIAIRNENPVLVDNLSKRGRAIFFPNKGIPAQAMEAADVRINATIGITLDDDGVPSHLTSIANMIDLPPQSIFPYPSNYGLKSLRKTWRKMLYEKNRSLNGILISDPVVTQGITHGLSMAAYLFIDPDESLYLPNIYWGNYRLIFKYMHGVQLKEYPFFNSRNTFNIDGLLEALDQGSPGKRVLLLNFPHNPSGYSLFQSEAEQLREALLSFVKAGNSAVVLIDDAYTGLTYEDTLFKESIFAYLATAHERILAVKIDGATKEDYAWGMRTAFITYGVKKGTSTLYQAMEHKTAGAIRSTISSASHLSQSLLLHAYRSADYSKEKAEKYAMLQKRYKKVKAILDAHPEYDSTYRALPFNSGYFLCLRPLHADVEVVRRILIKDYSTGTIATSGLIRVAYSSIAYSQLEQIFENIYQACHKAVN